MTFLSLQMQRHGPINWAKSNWTSFDIYTPFYLPVSPSQTRVMEFIFFINAILPKICRCRTGEGAPLFSCFNFVDRKIACICTPLLNERVVYSHHTRAHKSDLLNQRQWLIWLNNPHFYMETMVNKSVYI